MCSRFIPFVETYEVKEYIWIQTGWTYKCCKETDFIYGIIGDVYGVYIPTCMKP